MNDTSPSTIKTATAGDDRPGRDVAQRTLRHAISCVGVGRHSGARVSVTLQPATPGTGVRFRRSDRPGSSTIKARSDHLVIADYALILADGDGTRIAGIEHVVAALAMTGIDNAVVEVSGPELPAMDGSAQPFVFLIECAGAIEQDAARTACPPPPPVDLRRGDVMARIAPSAAPRLAADITGQSFAGNGPVQHTVALQRDALRHELAAARLPLTTTELEEAQSRGLMRGVSRDNTLLLADGRAINAGGLRFADEAARHANLLALAGLALLGGLPPVELVTRGVGYALLGRLLRQCGTARPAAVTAAPSTAEAAIVASIGQRVSSPA